MIGSKRHVKMPTCEKHNFETKQNMKYIMIIVGRAEGRIETARHQICMVIGLQFHRPWRGGARA